MQKKHDLTDPEFWVDKDGKHPYTFTSITVDDVEDGTWVPKDTSISRESILTYLKSIGKVSNPIPLQDDGSTRIQVSLTTSKFFAFGDGDDDMHKFIEYNIPICSARTHVALFGEKEMSEHTLAEKIKEMAGEVIVYPDTLSIVVKGSFGLPLIEYTDTMDEYCIEFFKRWKELKQLLFEFTVVNFNDENMFTLKGYWNANKWSHLEIVTQPMFNILRKS